MTSSQFGASDAGFFEDLFRQYRERMEGVAPFQAGIEAEGLDLPGREEIIQKYADYKNSGGSFLGQSAKDLVEAYIPYRDRVAQELKNRGFPDIQSGLDAFERDTGVRDYSEGRLPTYDYGQPLHELLSHQRPYDLGMAPDYRDFYAGKDPEGNPVVVKSNSITPINEDLAVDLDVNRSRALRNREFAPSEFQSITKGGFTDLLMRELNNREVLDDASRRLLPARMELQYPTRTEMTGSAIFPPTERVIGDVEGAYDLLKDKYMKPASQRLAGLLATQFPGISTKVTGVNDIERFLSLVENLEGKPTDRSKYFYGTVIPGVTPETVNKIAENIKRTPASLLPGAADLIPSPEAIRIGYAEGPVAMGQQMANEFVQSLPFAAAAATVLSTPVAAPLAPGLGAGMVGTAGARALNEVVRQETGEGIVPKVRQFLGTAPRTGVSSPGRVGERPLVAEIKPLSAAQKKQMQSDLVRSEMQRRLDLARERFNPVKGEFGISEVLFGR